MTKTSRRRMRKTLLALVLSQSAIPLLSPGLLRAADAASKVVPATAIVPAKPQPAEGGAARVATLTAGAQAPNFISKDLKGNPVRLSDWKGKVVVLDFWATWCGPCQKSLPHTQEVAKQYKDQGVVVLAVCTSDTRAKYEDWMARNQAKYPEVTFTCDPNERGSSSYDEQAGKKLYGVTGIPTQFVVGKDGKIAAVVVGYDQGDARLEAGLAKAGIKVNPQLVAKGEEQSKKN